MHFAVPQFVLNDKQKKFLRQYGEEFKIWIENEKGIRITTEHRDHEKYFKEKLSAQNLDKMTESEFAEIYKKLWASNMWRNKDWYIQNRLIVPNGLQKIKGELKKLLYSQNEDIINRYNQFRTNLRGFGNSSIREILPLE